ncbi:MAG TPA: hypothetical protein VGD14_02905 [bacterium]
MGPLSILMSWSNWGKFGCPGCGNQIQFRNWLLTVVALFGLFIGAERLLHLMLISQLPLWLSFLISSVLALVIMLLVPMVWTFKKAKRK